MKQQELFGPDAIGDSNVLHSIRRTFGVSEAELAQQSRNCACSSWR